MFAKLLSVLGLAPKNLDQAQATFSEAKQTLDSVAALFTAAGLNLEQMLAGGPDALKAHLASLDQSAELATLNTELSTLKEAHAEATELIAVLEEDAGVAAEICAAIGISADTKPEDRKAAYEAHLSRQVTLALAKTGHPPAHVPAVVDPAATAQQPDEAHLAEYERLSAAGQISARFDYFCKHEGPIKRAIDARAKAAK